MGSSNEGAYVVKRIREILYARLTIRQTIEQHGIDADKYALLTTLGIKDTITSHAITGFAIPVRSIFYSTANTTALRGYWLSAFRPARPAGQSASG